MNACKAGGLSTIDGKGVISLERQVRIYLPQSGPSLPPVPINNSSPLVQNNTSPVTNPQKENRSAPDSFLGYLDHWSKEAQKFDISETLKAAVDRVKSFPEDSVAFCVGVGELCNIASAEVAETSKEIVELIEKRGLLTGFKVIVKEGADFILVQLEPIYTKVQEAVASASRYILGDENHEALGSLFDKYVAPIGRYFLDQLERFFQTKSEDEKASKNDYQGISSFSSIDLSSSAIGNKDHGKHEFLGELISKSGDFLKSTKDFFAHNILDKDLDGVNALTPEILVEADPRTRPIFDPLPPAWVEREQQKKLKVSSLITVS